jgi:hypothetical protein
MPNNLNITSRGAPRRNCRVFGRVKYLNKETPGRVINLSTTGIAFELAGPFHGASGSKVRIECDDLGIVEGTVRWYRDNRIGVEFSKTSNASAQVNSYFRFFHKEVVPVLRR